MIWQLKLKSVIDFYADDAQRVDCHFSELQQT